MVRKLFTYSLSFFLLLSLASCANTSQKNVTPEIPPQTPVGESLGLMVLTLTGLNQPEIQASLRSYDAALGTQALEQITDGLDLKFINNKIENVAGRRYLNATFEVRNAQACRNTGTCSAYAEALSNGAFIAADTTTTLGHSAISRLVLANGQAANPDLAKEIQPTHALSYNKTTRLFDVVQADANFQAFSEAEVAALAINADARVHGLFPWGFSIVNRTNQSNILPANPANNTYDGVVTFAFSYPHTLGSGDSIDEISIVIQATKDTANRVTEGIHEQSTASAEQRADAFTPPAEVILLGNSPTKVTGNALTRICALRYAGTVAQPTFLFDEKTNFCGTSQEKTYTSNANQAIPDNSRVASQLTIEESGKIESLDIHLQFNHERGSDLEMYLVSPEGTTIRLMYDGSFETCTSPNFDMTLSDSATRQLIEYCANPQAVSYRPERRLATFAGESVKGTWSLYVRDIESGKQGTIVQWGIKAKVIPQPFMNFYVTQGTQNTRGAMGTVPLIPNRRALARFFLTNQLLQDIGIATGSLQEVRLVAYNASGLLGSTLLSLPAALPAAMNEGDLQSSLNANLPNSWLQAGLRFKFILTATSGRYTYPTTGFLLVPEVLESPKAFIDFIPVQNGNNNASLPAITAADITAHQAELLYTTKWMMPMQTQTGIEARVLPTYVTTSTSVQDVQRELEQKHRLDGTKHHYVGIGDYGGNYLGLGTTPGYVVSMRISRSQFLDTSSPNYNIRLSQSLSHELGHNWNLSHTPCGNAIRPNLSYPYKEGSTGAWGINLDPSLNGNAGIKTPHSLSLRGHRDVMGYCGPRWISDFNYGLVARYRQQQAQRSRAKTAATFISGYIDAEGHVTLEPAFDFEGVVTHNAQGRLQASAMNGEGLYTSSSDASYAVEMRNAAGTILATIPFTPEDIDHASSKLFNLVVLRIADVAHIAIVDLSNTTEVLAQQHGQALNFQAHDMTIAVEPVTSTAYEEVSQRLQLRWANIPQVQAVILRDPETLKVIGYSDTEHITLASDYSKDSIILDISNGVTSEQRTVVLGNY